MGRVNRVDAAIYSLRAWALLKSAAGLGASIDHIERRYQHKIKLKLIVKYKQKFESQELQNAADVSD
jgi:hypothetical protein